MEKKNTQQGGISINSLLLVIFIVLKLTNLIDWKWIWVLAPLWINLILAVLVLIGVAIYVAHDETKGQTNKWKF